MKKKILALGIPTCDRPYRAIEAIKKAISVGIYDQIIVSSNSHEYQIDDFIYKLKSKKVTYHQNNSNIGIVNVCKGSPVSIRNLVENVVKENNSNIELELGYYPYRKSESMSLWGGDAYLNELINLSVQ